MRSFTVLIAALALIFILGCVQPTGPVPPVPIPPTPTGPGITANDVTALPSDALLGQYIIGAWASTDIIYSSGKVIRNSNNTPFEFQLPLEKLQRIQAFIMNKEYKIIETYYPPASTADLVVDSYAIMVINVNGETKLIESVSWIREILSEESNTAENGPWEFKNETLLALTNMRPFIENGCTSNIPTSPGGEGITSDALFDCPQFNIETGDFVTDRNTFFFYHDADFQGLGFPVLAYYPAYSGGEKIPAINEHCLQLCVGVRLIAYTENGFSFINDINQLKEAVGEINTPEKAYSYALLATGSQPLQDLPLNELSYPVMPRTNRVERNTNGYTVTLYDSTGGICCGTDYVYYKVTYSVKADGTITEFAREQVGRVFNNSIA